jgi:hypothetical protein
MDQLKELINIGKHPFGSYLVTLARTWQTGQEPTLFNAASYIDVARLAYDDLNATEHDEILVWTVEDYHTGKEPVAFNAVKVHINRPIRPHGGLTRPAGVLDDLMGQGKRVSNLHILLAWEAGEMTEEQAARLLGVDRLAARQMKLDAIETGKKLAQSAWICQE